MQNPVSCSEVPSLGIAGCQRSVQRLRQHLLILCLPYSFGHPHRHCRITRYHRSRGSRPHCRRWLLSWTSAEEMPLWCPSHMRIRFAVIFVGVFTDLNQKSNAAEQNPSSSETSRYALERLFLLNEHLQWETCSFQKIPQLRPHAVNLARQYASHGLSAELSQTSGNTLLLGSLEEHSPSPHVAGNRARFAAFCWFHRQFRNKKIIFPRQTFMEMHIEEMPKGSGGWNVSPTLLLLGYFCISS